jgi:hypothetical protein
VALKSRTGWSSMAGDTLSDCPAEFDAQAA